MNDSILITIKKMLGLEGDYTPFDTDIMVLINSAFFTLKQLGVGPANGFAITGADETFSDFIADPTRKAAIQNYIYLKVKIAFDSNSVSSGLLSAMQEQITELEHRLILDMETPCFQPTGD